MQTKPFVLMLLLGACLLAGPCQAQQITDPYRLLPELARVEQVLTSATPPTGVLFAVREHDEAAFEWVLPRVHRYVTLLRAHYPLMPIALISHGEEMRALTYDKHAQYGALQDSILALIHQSGLQFHVCQTFAERQGLRTEDFPTYFDFVPSAPRLIRDYRAVGFTIIKLQLTW